MSNNTRELIKFMLKHNINEEELVLDIDDEILYYKGFEFDLDDENTTVKVEGIDLFGCSKGIVDDGDGYILTIKESGKIEVETPEKTYTVDDVLEKLEIAIRELETVRKENEALKLELNAKDIIIEHYRFLLGLRKAR